MKSFLKYFCIVFFIFFVAVLSISCKKSIEEIISNNISETREHLFVARQGDIYASFTDGMREENYIMDGTSSLLVEYGVLVVKTNLDLGKNPTFSLKVMDKTYTGSMEINPFDSTYVADIGEKIAVCNQIFLTIASLDEMALDLISSSWAITSSKALNIFIMTHKADLEKMFSSQSRGEVYIKLVADSREEKNVYYYILAVSNGGEVIGSLIDVNTGEVVQK